MPLLPADPLELLVSWLRLTGLDPADCFGVSVSIREDQLAPFGDDGSARGEAGSLVSAVYRDRPSYEAGRVRFAQWARARGLIVEVEREHVGRALRAVLVATKLSLADRMGARAFRDHDISKGQDAQLWHYSGGNPPA